MDKQNHTHQSTHASTQAKPDSHHQGDTSLMTNYEWVSIGIQVLTLLAIIAYTVFSRRQWHAMDKANKLTSESAAFTKKALELSERPWVFQAALKAPTLDASVRLPIQLQFVVKNFGRGPAMNVVTNVGWEKAAPGVRFDKFEFKRTRPPDSAPTLMPEGITFNGVEIADTPENRAVIKGVLDGTVVLYVFGDCIYMDQFGNPRHSAWVQRYDRELKHWPFVGNLSKAD